MTNCPGDQQICTRDCGDPIFEKLWIMPRIAGGTIIQWKLSLAASLREGKSFQLQYGRTGIMTADDWQNVGNPVSETNILIDLSKRLYGQTDWSHYRIKMTALGGEVFYSPPISSMAAAPTFQDQQMIRGIMRRESERQRTGELMDGFLLKKKHYGETCEHCVDPATGAHTDSSCPFCKGTGFVEGYFPPVPCFFVELGTFVRDYRKSAEGGSVQDGPVSQARFVNIPQVTPDDVWVDKRTDNRWLLKSIQALVRVGSLELISVSLDCRLLPFTDVVYDIPVH